MRFTAILLVFAFLISCTGAPEAGVGTEPTGTLEEQPTEETHQTLEVGEAQSYVAVCDFEILTDDENTAGLSKDIAQEITSAFLRGNAIQPVEREEFNRLIDEIKLSMSYSDEEAQLEAGKVMGADYLLLGSFSKIGDQCKINFRLVDTETSEILFAQSVRGMFAHIFDLEEEVASIIEHHVVQ